MSAKLEKLTFTIDLLERVSGPIRKVQRVMGSMADASEKAFKKVGMGAAGVAGAGYSMMKFINPAEEMRQALGEVGSLDVDQDTLKGLSTKALQYSIKYGRAADGFVRSAYDIQSSINGLKGTDLAEFTNVANVLAVGGKSDSNTMTDYMGTMYGIFKAQAEKIGKVNWVKQLAGQTATAIQLFKTTGSEMSSAFTAVGANATSAGIDVVEQMAVMGKLQATMSGSEAGTKYKAFLAGAGKAQKKLGLSFVDSDGKMLGMLDILGKLKGKFGDTLSVAESDALKDAFGSDEAVSMLKLLMADTTGLAGAMDKLGQVKGMEKAEQMAAHMVTPMQRLGQGVTALTIGIGNGLAPALDPLINGIADATATMTAWMGKYPNLTRWIGYGVLAVITLTGVMGALTLVTGLMKLGFIGLSGPLAAAKWGLALFTKQGIIGKGVLLAFQGVMWLVNAAMAANPAVLIVLAIVALIAAVAAAIYWWDDLKAAFLDTSWGQAIMKVIDVVLGGLKALVNPIGFVMDHIGAIGEFFGFGSETAAPTTSPSLEASKRTNLPPGGVTNHIAKTVANNSSNSRSIGQVTINSEQPMTRQALDEMLYTGT
ncbi:MULTISPECIES: phage tail tape measure protein [unclassified Pseudodesulfovibrio]|uniref:phage tail tape measure protein n=1 Tax=unclassified Pseudodesulfovibrio TaxID=2661612 RepID=UPI000FEBBD4B|nr:MULTISPECIES: phage tail tape measure protein [unclassified Pseudodesulfovibrio]MCJ2164660.1 phage tail tape measure protein [Pseudodesulfovibrio sp. S3-i]RWU04148.1 phage tail tape measure protein [Pseudodesulfovibrio sp. S3]